MLSTDGEKRSKQIEELASELDREDIEKIISLKSSAREAALKVRVDDSIGTTIEIFDDMSTKLFYESVVEFIPGKHATFRTLSHHQTERVISSEFDGAILAYGVTKLMGEPIIEERLLRTDDMMSFMASDDWKQREDEWFEAAMNHFQARPQMIINLLMVAYQTWQNEVYSRLDSEPASVTAKKSTGT